MSDEVRRQYERLPYPPIGFLALPRRGQAGRISYEHGAMHLGESRSHEGIRILVAGAGTWETAVVAQAHPRAACVTAVDLSRRSIAILRRRLRWARLAAPVLRARPPRVKLVAADLLEWSPGETYDLILASNLLHHVADPAALLARLAGWLRPQGLLRVVTYPRQSRIWMRETSRFLRACGLSADSPGLFRAAARLVAELEPTDPIRSCFESQPERFTRAGIVDAFFHARENPLAPLEWEAACARAGLSLFAEDQTESSRSDFLTELLPRTESLSSWEKLQVLDDLLELCANPVLWLVKRGEATPSARAPEIFPPASDRTAELTHGLARAERLLARAGVTLDEAIEALRRDVGPRVSAPPKSRALPGLSILDHLPLGGNLESGDNRPVVANARQ